MKKLNYFILLIVGLFVIGSCQKDKPIDKKSINIDFQLPAAVTELEYIEDILYVPIDGIAPSVDLLITSLDGSSLSGVSYVVKLTDNTDTEHTWYTVVPSDNMLNISIPPHPESELTYRSVKVTVSGEGENYIIIPKSFTIYQMNYEKSNAAHFYTFSVPGESRKSIIYLNQVVEFFMPFGADVSNLTPTFTISDKATCSPASGVAQDFRETFIYTIISESGNEILFNVYPVFDDEPNHDADILGFSVSGQIDKPTITDNELEVIVTSDTDVTKLTPIITISEDATISPSSSQELDFTSPVEYIVTAQDKVITKKYKVTVFKGGESSMSPHGNLADGVVVSDINYTIPIEGSDMTNIQISLNINGNNITDFNRYNFTLEGIDLKDKSKADWITISEIANGIFSFSVNANNDISVRRAKITLTISDSMDEHKFGSSIINIEQNGTEEFANLIELIAVKGGRFLQGDSDIHDMKRETRWVNLTDFHIGKYEITQSQFQSIMGFNPSVSPIDGENCAIGSVTLWDAMAFCDKLSEREGYTKFYNITDKVYVRDHIVSANRNCDMSATGYRLPTIAEWEYAAKGGEEQINTKLYSFAGCEDSAIKDYAWFRENNGEKPSQVGTKLPNTLNIYDMSGNVSEWCHDWAYEYHVGDFISNDEVYDPFGPEEPYGGDQCGFSQGGYFDTYVYNLNILGRGKQAADNDLRGMGNLCNPTAFGLRVVIRK